MVGWYDDSEGETDTGRGRESEEGTRARAEESKEGTREGLL
jgi:hypothetical protein